jgi:hypothetical protein
VRSRFKSWFATSIIAAMLFVGVPAKAQYITGPRGGCYTVTSGGKKRYVDRSMCDPKSTAKQSTAPTSKYIRGPRGGCYYITPSGRKQYVDRSMCP